MATTITPGFTGYALISAVDARLRFNTCSLNAVQAVEAPDMVMGDYTHNAWAYGKIEVGGSISGPLTESSMTFLNEAWKGEQNIDVKYYGGYRRQFQGMWVNSITFNVTAGDVVNFTADFIGKGWDTTPDAVMNVYTNPEKLITWDKAALFYGTKQTSVFTGLNQIDHLQSFTITISNNITRQFAIKASDLYGNLVRGMSAVTGSLVNYELKSTEGMFGAWTQSGEGAEFWDAYSGADYYPIQFSVGGHTISCTVVFHRATSELSVGPVLTTVAFTGIGHWGGENLFTPVHTVISA